MDTARRNPPSLNQNPTRRPKTISRKASVDNSSSNVGSSRRSKSRSPSRGARQDPFAALNASMSATKLSSGSRSSKGTSTGSVRQSGVSSQDIDMLSDAGQRVKLTVLQRAHDSRPNTPASGPSGAQKRDKGKERQSKPHGAVPETSFSGPLAAAEFDRMRREIESLKSTVSEQKRSVKKQTKKIEDLKAEVASGKAVRDEQDAQIKLLKAKDHHSEELLTTIETSLTCNICMEILTKPFSLSPCGHTFCLQDLQEWFRKAPPTDDDMDLDMDDTEYYLKHRSKTCPACRAIIVGRPLPVYIVNNIIGAVQKSKLTATGDGATSRRSNSPYVSEDPWEGLFPNGSEYEEDEEDEEDEGMEFGLLYSDSADSEMDVQYESEEYDSNGEPDEEEGSAAEEEGGENVDPDDYSDEDDDTFILPQWEPPYYDVGPISEVGLQRQLIRRGCPPWLSTTYRMRYSHNNGLIAHLNSLDPDDVGLPLHGSTNRMHRLFLGWNIPGTDETFSEDSGRLFIIQLLEEFKAHASRFSVNERPNGCLDVRVLVSADSVNTYHTTDSEVWG
ncbi:hypothetical protein BDP27DRAFT_1310458 [Rhodocollybia butyracea]|uniref:RING-type domain-containing protein n=1 Tax=Rhodocollybia butyracea TaxID=206335 RepID=A0A9P5UGW0_9AGAR|nr:hypothetical protein BDP27DRAFT_1310458 [Rhodocollybia butyracea]